MCEPSTDFQLFLGALAPVTIKYALIFLTFLILHITFVVLPDPPR